MPVRLRPHGPQLQPRAVPLRHPAQRRRSPSQLAAGKDKPEVLSVLLAGKYGEKILSAPTTTGFNLVAWVTPFAVVFLIAAR